MSSDHPLPSSHDHIPYQQSPPSIPSFSEVSDLFHPGYFALETILNASNVVNTPARTPGTHTPPTRLDMLRVRSAPTVPHVGRRSSAQISLRDSANSRFRASRSEPFIGDEAPLTNIDSDSSSTRSKHLY